MRYSLTVLICICGKVKKIFHFVLQFFQHLTIVDPMTTEVPLPFQTQATQKLLKFNSLIQVLILLNLINFQTIWMFSIGRHHFCVIALQKCSMPFYLSIMRYMTPMRKKTIWMIHQQLRLLTTYLKED
jgi:hypothetical protein